MKRKPILLALALLLIVGAALWGVNYRLDHPPLTKADKEFRALVAGADSVQLVYIVPPKYEKEDVTLNAKQTHEFIQKFRFSEITQLSAGFGPGQNENGLDFLIFFRQNERFVGFHFWQGANESEMLQDFPQRPREKGSVYKLNPRANKRLNRTLDAYLPQRIRP